MRRVHFTDKYILNPTHPITVSLIGVGGTGSQVLAALARIDHALVALGHPGLHVAAYDPDEVSLANVGRQQFSVADRGLNKAIVLVTRVNRFFGLDWMAIPTPYGQGRPANIVISCVDSVKSRLAIADAIGNGSNGVDREKKTYWIDFGNGANHGQVVLGTLGCVKQPKSERYETVPEMKVITEMFDLSRVNEEDSGPSCSLAEALSKQDLFINSTLAQLGCALLWKLLSTGSVDYQGLYLNLDTMRVNPIKL